MSEKQVTIVTVICLILIVLGGAGCVYYFHFVKMEELEQIYQQVAAEVRQAQAKVDQIEGLKKKIGALELEEAELIKRIPDFTRMEYDVFANLLDDLRRRSGVVVPTARWVAAGRPAPVPGRPVRTIPPTVHKVQFDVQVQGSFYQLLRYVNLLEQQNRFINVESFNISRGQEATKDRPGPVRREMRLTLYSYTYRLPDETPYIEGEPPRYGRTTDIPD
jgi:Tfp pilus assembly protein PilO